MAERATKGPRVSMTVRVKPEVVETIDRLIERQGYGNRNDYANRAIIAQLERDEAAE